MGWRHDYSVLGTPLVDRDHLPSALDQLLSSWIGRRRPRLSVLDWIGDGPVLDTLTDLAAPHPLHTLSSFERPVLRRREDGQYLAALTKHRRKRLTQHRRQLEHEVGLVHVVDRAHEPAAWQRFLELEAAGWKGEAGTALASRPSHAAFFLDMAARFANAGRLELPSLETDDGVVLAMALRLQAADGVFQLKITYDESYRRYGPGRLLDVALLTTFQDETDQQWVDSCTDPGNDFKAALYPDRRTIRTLLIPARGRLNVEVARTLPMLRRSRHQVRELKQGFRAGSPGPKEHDMVNTAAVDARTDRSVERPASTPGTAAPQLHVQVEPLTEVTSETTRAWEDLARRACEPNPYFSPTLAVSAARHLASEDSPFLVLVFDGTEAVFAAPFVQTRHWRRLRLRAVRTWCHEQCFLGVPLIVDDDRAQMAWRLALDALAQLRPRPRMLILELLPIGGRVESALVGAAGARRFARYECYARATLDRTSLGSNIAPQRGRRRRSFERRSRQVERHTGTPFETRDVARDSDVVEQFLSLEAAGWVGRQQTALVSNPDTAAYARDGSSRLLERDELVMLATTTGKGVAAELFAIRDHDTLFMFKIAYDERLARFSPGTQLIHDMVQWFAADATLEHIDSCAHPENEFINRLLPDRREFATALVALDGGVDRLAVQMIPRLVSLRRRLRRFVR